LVLFTGPISPVSLIAPLPGVFAENWNGNLDVYEIFSATKLTLS